MTARSVCGFCSVGFDRWRLGLKEGIDIGKRLKELALRAEKTGIPVFTDFLNMHELSVFSGLSDIPEFRGAVVFGGCDGCERCMIRFGDGVENDGAGMIRFGDDSNGSGRIQSGTDREYEQRYVSSENEDNTDPMGGFPINIIRISPVQAKFADDLTHRDFLGSVMGLGIEREKTGDIIISDNTAYMFVHSDIAQFIVDSLEYVRHTHVRAEYSNSLPEAAKPRLEKRQVIISSNRIDAIISKLYNLSREQSLKAVTEGKVFVNGAEISSNSKSLKEGDVVSVRGFGKWIFRGESGKTRKDRLYVEVEVYT